MHNKTQNKLNKDRMQWHRNSLSVQVTPSIKMGSIAWLHMTPSIMMDSVVWEKQAYIKGLRENLVRSCPQITHSPAFWAEHRLCIPSREHNDLCASYQHRCVTGHWCLPHKEKWALWRVSGAQDKAGASLRAECPSRRRPSPAWLGFVGGDSFFVMG